MRERRRCAALWLCLAIFVARVVGQIEVLLLGPRWLPPFSAWWVTHARTRRHLTAFAAAYAGLMLLRLVITAALPPHSLIERGLIPIVVHWDLAGFIALLARTPTGRHRSRLNPRSHRSAPSGAPSAH